MLVLLVIVAMNSLALVIEQVGDIKGQYQFANVLAYVIWHMPGFIVSNVGFAALIGCLIGLGLLANHNELMVMRASGVSIMQIVWLVMRPVLLIVFMGLVLAEFTPYTDRIAEGSRDAAFEKNRAELEKRQVAPHNEKILNNGRRLGEKIKEKIKKGSAQLHFNTGLEDENSLWNREGNEFVRFTTVLPNGKVYGITRFLFSDDKTLISVLYANEGTYQQDGWLLENVKTTHFDKTITEDSQASLYWVTSLTPEMLTFVSTKPEDLTFSELGRYDEFLKQQQRDNRPYELEWWKKVIKPFEIFSLVLMAISFIFGPLRQVTMGQRVFTGVIVGVVFQTLQNMFTTSSLVFGFNPVMAVTVPVLVCASIGLVMLARVR